jgi:hypothetical protein
MSSLGHAGSGTGCGGDDGLFGAACCLLLLGPSVDRTPMELDSLDCNNFLGEATIAKLRFRVSWNRKMPEAQWDKVPKKK